MSPETRFTREMDLLQPAEIIFTCEQDLRQAAESHFTRAMDQILLNVSFFKRKCRPLIVQKRKKMSAYFGKRCLALLLVGLFAVGELRAEGHNEEHNYLNIVFIGNSITYGAGLEEPRREAPPVRAAIYLKREGVARIVRYSNQGVSGLTTTDFLPETGTYFEKVRAAADQFRDESWATLLFSIMLGTNDSATRGPNGAPLAPDAYAANLQRIVDRLLALYPSAKIVLHRPIWYSPNTYNRSEYLQAGLDRLTAYYPALRALVQDYEKRFPGQVFLGDTLGYTVFRDEAEALFQPEQGQAGVFRLHPNREGAVRLGELWGAAIRRALELKTKEDLEQE